MLHWLQSKYNPLGPDARVVAAMSNNAKVVYDANNPGTLYVKLRYHRGLDEKIVDSVLVTFFINYVKYQYDSGAKTLTVGQPHQHNSELTHANKTSTTHCEIWDNGTVHIIVKPDSTIKQVIVDDILTLLLPPASIAIE